MQAAGDAVQAYLAEQVEVVNWAGNPHKAVSVGPGQSLTPRASFDAWHDEVKGRSRRWTLAEIDAAFPQGVSAGARYGGSMAGALNG